MDKANDTDEPEQRFVSKITPHHRVFPLSISGLIAERSAKGEPNTNAPTSPTYYRQPLPMTLAEAQRSRGVLAQLDTIDEVKYKISVAKNDFEAYLIWAKTADIIDYMKEAMHYVTVVTARSLSSSDSISSDINEGSSPEVAMFDRSLEEYSDWLQTVSDDGVTAIQEEVGIDNTLVTASTYSTKLSELKAYVQRTAEGLEGRIMTIKEGVKKKEEGAMDSRLLAFSSSELKRKEPSILEQEEDLVSLD